MLKTELRLSKDPGRQSNELYCMECLFVINDSKTNDFEEIMFAGVADNLTRGVVSDDLIEEQMAFNRGYDGSSIRHVKVYGEWGEQYEDFYNAENFGSADLEERFNKLNINREKSWNEDEDLIFALQLSQVEFESSKNSRVEKMQEEVKQVPPPVLPIINTGNPNSDPRQALVSVFVPTNTIRTNPEDSYTLVKKIGAGGSGEVYLCKKKATNDYFAMKIMKLSSEAPKHLILNEVNLTINSHHKNIINYLEAYEHKSSIWIVEELMSDSLYDIISKKPGQIPEKISGYILREILKGLNYLHSRHRIHRDIKSDNILLSHQGEIKIADLGLCAQVNKNQPNRQTFSGTLLWMAPEVLKQEKYNFKIDIWSLGIVAFELGSGEPPYYHESQTKIVSNVINQKPARLVDSIASSFDFNSFIDRCLVKDPENRACTDELLNHPFITNCDCSFEEFFKFLQDARS